LCIITEYRMMRRRRRGRQGRHPIPVYIEQPAATREFNPEPSSRAPPVMLEPAELEAMRLVDLEGLSQEEAGGRMRVSRGTVWRLLQSARQKVTSALVEGRPLTIHDQGDAPEKA